MAEEVHAPASYDKSGLPFGPEATVSTVLLVTVRRATDKKISEVATTAKPQSFL